MIHYLYPALYCNPLCKNSLHYTHYHIVGTIQVLCSISYNWIRHTWHDAVCAFHNKETGNLPLHNILPLSLLSSQLKAAFLDPTVKVNKSSTHVFRPIIEFCVLISPYTEHVGDKSQTTVRIPMAIYCPSCTSLYQQVGVCCCHNTHNIITVHYRVRIIAGGTGNVAVNFIFWLLQAVTVPLLGK